MRNVLVPLFYIWLFVALGVLAHRRVTTGSFRPPAGEKQGRESSTPALVDHDFAPPSPPPKADPEPAGADRASAPAPSAPVALEDPPCTLAEAVTGISMPCGLVPVVSDRVDPCHVAFSTTGHEAATVGTAMADELERLGYGITPLDDRSVKAERPGTELEIRIMSAQLDSAEVMAERFPSVGSHALVVDLRLV